MRKQHLDRHVVLACLSGEEIEGDLVEVCDDDVSIDIDTESAHDMAGVLLFVSLAEIEAVP